MEQTTVYTQGHSVIGSRNVWHYLISTEIGQINVIQYEQPDLCLKTILYYNNYAAAEKKYEQIAVAMLKGRI